MCFFISYHEHFFFNCSWYAHQHKSKEWNCSALLSAPASLLSTLHWTKKTQGALTALVQWLPSPRSWVLYFSLIMSFLCRMSKNMRVREEISSSEINFLTSGTQAGFSLFFLLPTSQIWYSFLQTTRKATEVLSLFPHSSTSLRGKHSLTRVDVVSLGRGKAEVRAFPGWTTWVVPCGHRNP